MQDGEVIQPTLCRLLQSLHRLCLDMGRLQTSNFVGLMRSLLCRNLMVKQDLRDLGFKATTTDSGSADGRQEPQHTEGPAAGRPAAPADKKKQGFIAGIR